MTQLSVQSAIDLGIQHHRAGRLADAERIYRAILAQRPGDASALHLLGVIAHQVGQHDAAIELIQRAIAIVPNDPVFHSNLAEACRALKRYDLAQSALCRALALKPDHAEAHNNLANVLKDLGQLDEAASSYERALAIEPNFATAWFNLGNVRSSQEQYKEAILAYERAARLAPSLAQIYLPLGNALSALEKWDAAATAYARAAELNPNDADAPYNLGNTLQRLGKFPQAISAYLRAARLNPGYFGIYNNLGNMYHELWRLDDAAAAYTKAIALQPDAVEAYNNLGAVRTIQGLLDDAVNACSQAIALKPDHAAAHSNLGRALLDRGEIDRALSEYSQAMALDPADAIYHSNYVYALHFHPDTDASTLYREHRRWNELHGRPLASRTSPQNRTTANRSGRLKIGYVSPDFFEHPVGRFLLPLLSHHDRTSFQIYCYSDVRAPDAMTQRLRGHTNVWRDILSLSDEQAADVIRQDEIDLLVDLTMHTSHNRLQLFARKPAPVQVSYLAYCSTTGLDAIDYRLTDRYIDPPGVGDAFYSEKSIRLPETYWCYDPPSDAPDPGALAAHEPGHVTFGCLNNFRKVSEPALRTWCRILREVPGAKLILHARDGSHRQRVSDLLRSEGVDPARLTFIGFMDTADYFRAYQEIDIALDPFPCAGGTTTCDALWMGVPVLTLRGATSVGRMGVSMLSNVGLTDWIAQSTDQYVDRAKAFSGDLAKLASVRASLRNLMQSSPLMDAPRFARDVESAFREMCRR